MFALKKERKHNQLAQVISIFYDFSFEDYKKIYILSLFKQHRYLQQFLKIKNVISKMKSLQNYNQIIGNAYYMTDFNDVNKQLEKIIHQDPELLKQLRNSYDEILRYKKIHRG